MREARTKGVSKLSKGVNCSRKGKMWMLTRDQVVLGAVSGCLLSELSRCPFPKATT